MADSGRSEADSPGTGRSAEGGAGARGPALELHARGGRAVLLSRSGREVDPRRLGLPSPLIESLHEWGRVVEAHRGPYRSSEAELVSRRGTQLAMRVATETGHQVGYADPVSATIVPIGPAPRRARKVPPARPTPWSTGLGVSAVIAAIVVVVLVLVTLGLADVNPVLAVVINLAVVAGMVPSIWIGRNVPVWRWVALGAAAGIVLSWIALLLSTLG